MQDLHPEIIAQLIEDNPPFPNNPCFPLLLYKNCLSQHETSPEAFEEIFQKNKWLHLWRNGIFPYHHYHSNTHEVLGIYSGSCTAQIGGEGGKTFELCKGDVLVIPAGVSHKNNTCSSDFRCIGAYPTEIIYDMCTGKETEYETAKRKVQQVLIPHTDPIFGKKGPLFNYWT